MKAMLKAKYQPDSEYRFWLYDPNGNGMLYYSTPEDRDAAAAEAVAAYLEPGEGWATEVEEVVAGEVTHVAQCLDKQMRPDDLDEEDCDGEGVYWGEFAWMGTYKMEPIDAQAKTPNAAVQRGTEAQP